MPCMASIEEAWKTASDDQTAQGGIRGDVSDYKVKFVIGCFLTISVVT